LGNFGKGVESQKALSFETKLRRAATKVLAGASGALTDATFVDDLLEGIACQACDIFDSHESKKTDRASIREALMESLEPLLEGELQEVAAELCDELLDAADLPKELASPSSEKPLPLKVPEEHHAKEATVYQRRGDRERERAAEYLREHAAEEQRQREEELNCQRESLQFTRWPTASKEAVGVPLPSATEKTASDSEEEEDEVSRAHRESTQRRLRELGQPATFFAETDAQRWDRLQRCELARDQDVLADGSTNVMQILDRRQQREREAAGGIRGMDIVDVEDAEFAALEGTVSRHEPDVEQDSASEEEASGPRLAAVLGQQSERDKEAEEAQKKLDEASHEVTSWIRSMLRAWEADLTTRAPMEEKHQVFKAEKAQYRQSKQYLKPLRRALRDGEVDAGVIFSLAEIAKDSGQRRYRAAKEAYMRLAIGNHPWPMGVTFVTFHDRAARHKIGEGAQAHVLDDETTRKYVQMVKRLVTFAERRWPIDPTQEE